MYRSFLLITTVFFLFSCNGDENNFGNIPSPNDNSDWLVPQSEVFDGGPGLDGIPSVDEPNFNKIADINFLSDDDLVLVIAEGDIIKAYPHPILDWHEIVNDQIGSKKLAITYCPLTGTGVAWNRVLNGEETTFGVSGLLYNSNLMPYDRQTGSTWSQQSLLCVNGDLKGIRSENYSLIETSFATLKMAFPNAEVLNLNTGFNRNYGVYPYNDYRTNNSRLLFPISNEDDRLPAKERTLGVINLEKESRVYSFDDGDQMLDVVKDNLSGEDLIIVRSRQLNLIVAFKNTNNLNIIENKFPTILVDQDGNEYDIMGRSTSDIPPLQMPTQFIGYWFSWGTFYPNIDLME